MAFFEKGFTSSVAAKERTSGGGYLNLSKLDPDGGSTRFHILSESPVTGWELWFEKNEGGLAPRRTHGEPDEAIIKELEADVGGHLSIRDGRPAIKQFAAFFVWDYEADEIRIVAPTQKTILRELARLTEDPDYADLSEWDCQITRSGKGTDTKYAVDMKPSRAKGAVASRMAAAWAEAEANGADLGALFTNGNPFGG
jgi:hypothetical protein